MQAAPRVITMIQRGTYIKYLFLFQSETALYIQMRQNNST